MLDILAGLVLPLALAYLAGSFPSAVVFGRLLRGVDPRDSGSGNAGATNALRSLGALPAALTLLADVAKALAAVFLAPLAARLAAAPPLGPADLAALCAAGAVIGHVLPLFARFRGGKGVAVAAAALGALHPWAVPWCVLAFALALTLTGYASVASLAAAACFPAAAFLTGSPLPWRAADGALPGIVALAAPLVILATHRRNIGRLVSGSEGRFPKAMLWRRALLRLRSQSGK
jgi:acyl phosphate:glycerol-3-phosphate acyltransferase